MSTSLCEFFLVEVLLFVVSVSFFVVVENKFFLLHSSINVIVCMIIY